MPPRVITPSGLSDNTIGYFAPHQRYSAAVRPGHAEGPTGSPDVLALRRASPARSSPPLLLSFGIPRRAANLHLALLGMPAVAGVLAW